MLVDASVVIGRATKCYQVQWGTDYYVLHEIVREDKMTMKNITLNILSTISLSIVILLR